MSIHTENPSSESDSKAKVKVALRIRPLISKELIEGSLKCIESFPQTSQIVIGKDKSFTFDQIYDENSSQEEIYRTFVRDLVLGCFSGYNATILAYGQTGSGKTYTMGSAISTKHEDTGIISRVIKDICNEIDLRKSKTEFLIKVSYLEIYNEEIYDLLDSTLTSSARSKLAKPNNSINIREEKDGSISIYGITEEKVSTIEEMMACLERGSLHRSTASTLMNEVSSRSHAIFTVTLEQHIVDDLYKSKTPNRQPNKNAIEQTTTGFMTAKFHFVDLAGSERIKKTGAVGNVMREGININRGLLVLGNVISALTDTSSKNIHVPYRESKLTRILQDSLGGNSLTGMIACVSPAESNYEESLNTIKYANRARNIQNTPHINRDPQTALISQLKQQIFELQGENVSLKQLLSKTDIKWEGKTPPPSSGRSVSPMGQKSGGDLEQEDIKNLKIRLIQVEKLNKKLQSDALNRQKSLNELEISLYTISKERDLLRLYNEKYKEGKLDCMSSQSELEDIKSKQKILDSYRAEIERLKQEIAKKDEFTRELQLEYEQLLISSRKDQDLLVEKIRLLALCKKHIEKLEGQRVDPNAVIRESDKSSQEIDRSIQEVGNEEDEEWEEMEKELNSIRSSAENELNCMTGRLKEKEELLKNITEHNLELEKSLVDVMKNQYHQKISTLESELAGLIGEVKRIEGQRDKALLQLNHNSNKENKDSEEKTKGIILNYKSKITQLEGQLKDFRKKEKDQQNLHRLIQSQQNKIQELANEIKNIRQQKIQLNRKYREELEKLEKFKALRNKEKLDWKKRESEKEQQISRLKTEKEKLSVLMKKKDEEIINNKKSQELFRNLCSKDFKQANDPKLLAQNPLFPVQRRYPTRKNAHILEDKMNVLSCEFEPSDENISLGLDALQERAVRILDLEQRVLSEEGELKRTEGDLEQEMKKLSELLLRKEKISIEINCHAHDLEEEEGLRQQKGELETEINELSMRVENLEDKIEFLRGKLHELRTKCQKCGVVADIFSQFIQVERSPRTVLKAVMEKWEELLREIIRMQEEIKRKTLEIKELSGKYSDLEIKYNLAETSFQQNMNKMRQEYDKKHLKLLQQMDLYNVCLKESKSNDLSSNLEEKVEKMEIETGCMNQLISKNEENSQKESLKSTNHEIKLVSFKEKRQMIRQEKLKENPEKAISQPNPPEIEKLKDLEKLKPKSPARKRPLQVSQVSPISPESQPKKPEKQPSFQEMSLNNFFPEFKDFSSCGRSFLDLKVEENTGFQCVYQQNIANSSIEAMKIVDKILFVAHENGVQVMDLGCNRVVNQWRLESPDMRITSLSINRERNLLAFAFENYIELRDLCTYQKVELLKARTPLIRDLSCLDNMLFSAGKGSISKGSLFSWDLRKMSWTKEYEKNTDISKILVKERVLYYGGKEKIIKRMNIDTGLNIYPYVQKHSDCIVSMAGLEDHVVSGSRDKTIKLWNANNFIENCTDSSNPEQNAAKTLEASYAYSNVFFSGGTDGKLGIWGLSSEKLKKVFETDAHQGSINAVLESNQTNSQILITGSSDELVKMWKAGEDITSMIC